MKSEDRSHVKYGIITMMTWCVIIVIVSSVYIILSGQTMNCLSDENTGGWGLLFFFVLWAFIWYKIGSHHRKVYVLKKEEYKDLFPNLSEKDLNACLKKECFVKSSKILGIVFATAVPWYMIGNVSGSVTTKDMICVGLLMALSIACFVYYKQNNRIEKNQND